MLSSQLPIGQLNKLNGTMIIVSPAVHTKLEGQFGLNGPLCFYTSVIKSLIDKWLNRNVLRYLDSPI